MDKRTYIKKYLNIKDDELISYGSDKFKVSQNLLSRTKDMPKGHLILVTSINPTSAGEGKTTMSIGLAQGLKKLNKKVTLALREPSMGPVFGQKGGGTGGGLCKIEPSLEIDLHFTGDIHALASAHNLLSAVIDQHIYFGNKLGIDKVTWPRTLDVNDRSLRKIQTTQGEGSFVITSASEMMAILALTADFKDLKHRIASIVIGSNLQGMNVSVADLGCTDALCILLKEAIKPNIVLSTEGVPAFVHAGPFANIAHGCNSILATNTALALSDYVVTEAGFGADLGAEKFLHIKLPHLNTKVKVVVVVATLRALKLHGNVSADKLEELNVDDLTKGIANLEKHLENIKNWGLSSVVALNIHDSDHLEEMKIFEKWASEEKINYAYARGYTQGGDGMIDLAQKVLGEIDKKQSVFKPTYAYKDTLEEKILKIAQKIYGATDVKYSKRVLLKLKQMSHIDFPVCMAKTPLSLTHDASSKGRPKGFTLEISDMYVSYGAELLVVLTKGIYTMPGLNAHPRVLEFRVSDEGEVLL